MVLCAARLSTAMALWLVSHLVRIKTDVETHKKSGIVGYSMPLIEKSFNS